MRLLRRAKILKILAQQSTVITTVPKSLRTLGRIVKSNGNGIWNIGGMVTRYVINEVFTNASPNDFIKGQGQNQNSKHFANLQCQMKPQKYFTEFS